MVKITDTTFRDAHQSLAATRMKTEHMLPIARMMNDLDLWSAEIWGGATFHTMILKDVDENPWDRITLLKEAMPDIPLQMLLRGQNLVGYKHYADDVVEAFVDEAVERGIKVFRVFDALNYFPNLESSINRLRWHREHGADVIIEGCFSYTTSPVHSTDGFVNDGKAIYRMGCDTICSKDMAGLLEAKIADELYRKLIGATGLPVHSHNHDSCRLAEEVYLTGAKVAKETGVDVIIDVSFPPFAGGSAQPSILTMVKKLKDAGYDTGLDYGLLEKISDEVAKIMPHYQQYMKAGGVTPEQIIKSQIPGGMIANLVKQLRDLKLITDENTKLLDLALEEEVPMVREEYGYPPLVTPTSQIVGSQAVFNILAKSIGKERYTFPTLVTNETRAYLRGEYGQPPGAVDENVRDMVLGKGAKLITDRPANHIEPGLEKAKGIAESVLGKGKAIRGDVLTCALYEIDGPAYLQRQMAQGGR